MTTQYSTTVRNGVLDAWETAIGPTPIIEIRTGAQPANCAAASTGTLLATYTLASDWATAASGGIKSLANLPLTTTAVATGPRREFAFIGNGYRWFYRLLTGKEAPQPIYHVTVEGDGLGGEAIKTAKALERRIMSAARNYAQPVGA